MRLFTILLRAQDYCLCLLMCQFEELELLFRISPERAISVTLCIRIVERNWSVYNFLVHRAGHLQSLGHCPAHILYQLFLIFLRNLNIIWAFQQKRIHLKIATRRVTIIPNGVVS